MPCRSAFAAGKNKNLTTIYLFLKKKNHVGDPCRSRGRKIRQLLVTRIPSVIAENQIVQIRGLRATRIPFQNHGSTPPLLDGKHNITTLFAGMQV